MAETTYHSFLDVLKLCRKHSIEIVVNENVRLNHPLRLKFYKPKRIMKLVYWGTNDEEIFARHSLNSRSNFDGFLVDIPIRFLQDVDEFPTMSQYLYNELIKTFDLIFEDIKHDEVDAKAADETLRSILWNAYSSDQIIDVRYYTSRILNTSNETITDYGGVIVDCRNPKENLGVITEFSNTEIDHLRLKISAIDTVYNRIINYTMQLRKGETE